MLELRDVHKSYHVGTKSLHVLRGVSLSIGASEMVAIMGASGSGKSTLLHVMGLLDAHDSGEYRLDGQVVARLSETESAKLRSRKVGFVFQSFNLIAFKTALENVALPLYYQGVARKKRNVIASELLERLGLLDWAGHLPSEMSGGQQQRVAIARALITQPKVLFADEPTGALDSTTSREVIEVLRNVCDGGVTTVIVTHEKAVADATDRVIRLVDGVVVSQSGRAEVAHVLDLDSWQEILETLRRNKLRTFLTAFSVAWGIFMLVVLLGSGQGLSNGVKYQFRDDAINSLWIWGGETSLPFEGLVPGRKVQLTNDDFDDLKSNVPGAERVAERAYIGGSVNIVHGRESSSYDVRCVNPDHLYLEKTLVTAGRFLNELDIAERRKVAVVGKLVKEGLFKGADPIGEQIEINGVAFKVVGVFEDAGGQGEMEKIYLPVSTAQRTYNGGNRINQIMVSVGDASLERSKVMAADVRHRLAAHHRFSPEDERAVRVNNNVVEFQRFNAVTAGIRAFTWLVGVGTILAGIVGVSNIMLITVRERTREIGIRKALGATPRSIIAQVLQESILVTSIAGVAGLVLGVVVLDVASHLLTGSEFFRDPQVDIGTALEATVVLIAAGTLAGLFPARRAAAIRPVEALREE